MLQEFRVDNYKSLINMTFRPQEMNLLLGLNNSGKTNLCQALRFASGSVLGSLDQCANMISGTRTRITNHFLQKETIDFFIRSIICYEDEELTFEYELTVLPPKNPVIDATIKVEYEKLTVTGGKFENTVLIENNQDKVKLLHENDYLKGKENYIETSAPRDVTMLNRLYNLDNNHRANLFKRYLSWWSYYDLSISALRTSVQTKPNEFLLNVDGSNLSSVIYRLKTSNERDYRKLLKCLQDIEPQIEVINFQVASENNVFMYFEDAQGHTLESWNASSGTLRFLAVIYVLLFQKVPLTPLITIEEPENGIYVGYLKNLVEMTQQSSNHLQLIFTSHSPYFIDLFDSRLEQVFILKRDKQHSALTQPDIEQVKTRLNNFPLGEQHFREML